MNLACSIWARLRGLKRWRSFKDVLLLAPCNDVHTFGMKQSIDIAFVSMAGVVVTSYRAVPARKRLRCKKAVAVLERYATDAPWLKKGDRLGLEIEEENHEMRY